MSNIIPINGDGPLLTISEDKVTLDELQCVLRSIFIECERHDDRLQVLDGLDDPCSLRIDHDRKLVLFVSIIKCEGTLPQALEKVNDLNGSLILARFHCDEDGDVWAEYFMTYDGGLNVRQFVKLLRRFAKLVNMVETDALGAPSSSVPASTTPNA